LDCLVRTRVDRLFWRSVDAVVRLLRINEREGLTVAAALVFLAIGLALIASAFLISPASRR
jgi:hypothetical protein